MLLLDEALGLSTGITFCFFTFLLTAVSLFPVSGTLLKNNQGQEKLIRNKLLSLVFSRSCLKAALFTSQM